MRNVIIFLSLMIMFVLAGCGGNKFDDEIDKVISLEKKSQEEADLDANGIERENALVRVYDRGKYIQLGFYSDDQKRLSYYYYEKIGDSYRELDHMPGDGTGDRLGLDRKTPDYEEDRGKETKLEN
ncbi:cystatin-like fold lipoprotein [Bacillus swezeyi]|uniref:Cystatin-like fold lipoprotein n=1 Tax=Bacillus swezeyi TaxID=1925020 RepID=A0A5M8RNB6_9BACI|nr:cystatin-like fold lipoprotein [Bacillus swezeyi]KAA6449361.1 cystatin-like fold lipoprotein [Bacillus swezeyi]KAA6474127.1 cystatin-like fold lipoprotein [Bacillus swezeyi]TYS33379.1 cystatin-like fold lipoprotein [Bacillus swezeyi]